MAKYRYQKKVGNQWLPTDVRFLRKGDRWKIIYQDGTEVEMTAICDAYQRESNGEWDIRSKQ